MVQEILVGHVLKVLGAVKIKVMKISKLRNIIQKIILEQEQELPKKELPKKDIEKIIQKPKPKPEPDSSGERPDKTPSKGPKRGCMDDGNHPLSPYPGNPALNYDPEAVIGGFELCEYPPEPEPEEEETEDNCCAELDQISNTFFTQSEEYENLLAFYYQFRNLMIVGLQINSDNFQANDEGTYEYVGPETNSFLQSSWISSTNNSLIFADGTISNLGITGGPSMAPLAYFNPIPPIPSYPSVGNAPGGSFTNSIPPWSPSGTDFLQINFSEYFGIPANSIVGDAYGMEESACAWGNAFYSCINNYNQGMQYLLDGSPASGENLGNLYFGLLEYYNDVLNPLQQTECCPYAAKIGGPSPLPNLDEPVPTV